MYDKRDDFNFKIVKFPFMDSNIPTKPAYGVYVSQLVRIGRICERYETFVERHRMITSRLLESNIRYIHQNITYHLHVLCSWSTCDA